MGRTRQDGFPAEVGLAEEGDHDVQKRSSPIQTEGRRSKAEIERKRAMSKGA